MGFYSYTLIHASPEITSTIKSIVEVFLRSSLRRIFHNRSPRVILPHIWSSETGEKLYLRSIIEHIQYFYQFVLNQGGGYIQGDLKQQRG
ncbi:hypothetical protein HanPSC8_Chr13g0559201 [Helianthus annuus]|nr:hypothetical protein HanPSC8_Chr13g0559201 [Helianthus annuus]